MVVTAAGMPLAPALAAKSADEKAEIFDIRLGVDARKRTRIVLDVTADPHYRARIAESAGGKQLLVEIDHAGFDIGGRATGDGAGIGQLGGYRFSGSADGLATLAFDLAETAVPQAVFVIKPKGDTSHHRLVIDMAAASEAAFAEQISREHGPMQGGVRLAPLEPAETLAASMPVRPQTRPEPVGTAGEEELPAPASAASRFAAVDDLPVPRVKPRAIAEAPAPAPTTRTARKVILDAGHGGRDPGAIGAGGNLEKDVVLAAAKLLQEELLARGYQVVMTRDSDVKIELEDRMPRQSKEPADLFISIHADSIERDDVRGASVYTLSKRGELRLANQINRMKENGDAVIANVDIAAEESDIGAIIADLASNRAQESSAIFAQHLIRNLDGRVAMLNNTHRRENLIVLLAPDMPAVLLELGFMSNKHDEANLIRENWREGAMEAVADGIDDYFAEQFPARHVSLVEGAR